MMVELPLKNKNILFLSPAFFNYENEIVKEMESLGAQVVYFDERSVKSPISRAFLKINPKIFSVRTKKYYDNIFKLTEKIKFDYILVVRADMVSDSQIKMFKLKNPSAKVILYLWDSIKNVVGVSSKIAEFDEAYTFDRKDAAENDYLKFRPLFFLNKFKQRKNNISYKYKMSFIGTIHSDRYGLVKKIENTMLLDGYKVYVYPFLQSKFVFFLFKFMKNDFSKTKISDFMYKPLSMKSVVEIEESSEIILDIQHPKQTGLTMRTIEMLGMQKKMITTNSEIMKYDFYDSSNILIVDRKNPVIDESFLNCKYKSTPNNIYEKYSIKNWILEILNGTEI